MIYLKQSTASQEIPLGYFLDSTDGNTEETALTIANTDIKIWKTGATTLANKNSGGATHISNGIYYATLDATDTNTLGPMVIFVHVSGALVVRLECCVLAANVYDSLIGATDQLQVDAIQISGDATAADNLELDYDGTGYNKSNSTIGTCTTNTDMRGTDSALLASSAPTNFSDLAITVTTGKVTVGTNDDKTGYSISGTTTTLDALNDLDAAGVRSAVGLASANLDTQLSTIDTVVDAVLVDTGTTLPASIATIDSNVDAILVDTGTTLPASIATIDANVDAILLDTGTDGVVLAGTPDVNVAQISGSATAADNLEASALGIVKGACEGTPSTTVIQTDLAETTDDHYIGRVVVFTSGSAAGEATDITDYTGSTGTLTVTALTTAPSATDTFVIV